MLLLQHYYLKISLSGLGFGFLFCLLEIFCLVLYFFTDEMLTLITDLCKSNLLTIDMKGSEEGESFLKYLIHFEMEHISS